MDPLITNGIDPALLRVLDKRGQERDQTARRKRPAPPEKPDAEEQDVAPEGENNSNDEPGSENPKHALDDLA
ncbi:MAG: hypothetical protein ABR908_01325 [Terriglobales bacterium]|jgi:hypothetical protein